MRILAKLLAAVSFVGLAVGNAAAMEPHPVAQEPQVTVTGGGLGGVRSDGIEFFKGVPYAAPPVGNLRWAPPQQASPWLNVRKAANYGHDCMQEPFPFDAAPLQTTPSEDCLYLNVWRPAGAVANLPVMVWIHGGGYVNGGASPAVYDGSAFARDGVILVSFNYRLGRFGFFGFPALTANGGDSPLGNYGLMDQIAALRWVKANIAAFGGDPGNITVVGESAGGDSVHSLLGSPMASGLFNKAIIESGGGRGNLLGERELTKDLPNMPSAETVGVNFARANGIPGEGQEALAALRALPAEKVVDGLSMLTMNTVAGPPTYGGPVIDGKIVLGSPEQQYRIGAFAQVPIMAGANSGDLGLGAAKTIDDALAPFGLQNKAKARAAYHADKSTSVGLVNWVVAMDWMMIEPARFAAQQFSSRGLTAYEFRFSYVASAAASKSAANPMVAGLRTSYPQLFEYLSMNAQHASEIPYVFDTVSAVYGAQTTVEDERTAKIMHAYWVNFAKSGNPNAPALAPGAPQWPAYTTQSDLLLNFTRDGPKVMTDPWKMRLDLTAERMN